MKPGDKVVFKEQNTSYQKGIKTIKRVYTRPAVTFASFVDDTAGYSVDQLLLIEEGAESRLEKEVESLKLKIKELEEKLSIT